MGPLTNKSSAYHFELLFDKSPNLDLAKVVDKLQKECGTIEIVSSEKDSFSLAFLDHMVKYPEKIVPVTLFAGFDPPPLENTRVEDMLRESWMWPEVRSVFANHKARILFSILMAKGLPYKERLGLYHKIVGSILRALPCLAIYWYASNQLLSPQAYLEERAKPQPNPLLGALNVRMFKVKDRLAGETIMDTLGLAALGLPDLQCHFTGLNLDHVDNLLYNAALYIYDKGDVIKDGQTFGLSPSQKWVCRHEVSLAAPQREVIDIEPDAPHSVRNLKLQ